MDILMTLIRSTLLLTAVYIALTANLQPANILLDEEGNPVDIDE